jgi:hypothetical protein
MSPMHRLSVVLLFTATACAVKTEKNPDSTVVDSTTVTTSSTTVTPAPSQTTPPAQNPPPPRAPAPAPADTPNTTTWTVTAAGLGPLRAGQTIAQANAAVGGGFSGSTANCTYAVWPKAPAGVAVMLANGRVARVEVRSGSTATAAGARIGDSEARINSLYAGRVTSAPHKYNPGGHYMTVTGGGSNRIVFETDGSSVTNYRAGRTPEVEQVERCG